MASDVFHIAPRYQPIARRVGLDAEAVFSHPQIVVWRKLEDRENCPLDTTFDNGSSIRLHVKRYRTPQPVADEVAGYELLRAAGIPSATLAGWGTLADGRSFILTEDLSGYRDAEKLVEAGTS